MERLQETDLSQERNNLEIPATDCYVEFGHSIEQYKDGSWHLTRLLQQVHDKDEIDEETGYPWYVRTGKAAKLDQTTPDAIVGGGVFVTAATVEAYKYLHLRGTDPKLVIHCGGRPGYIEQNTPEHPEVSEGAVMQEAFNSRLQHLPAPKQRLIDYGRTTEDDIKNSLDQVIDNGLNSVTFVGLGLRFPRFDALLSKIKLGTDKYNEVEVHLLKAEDVLRNKAHTLGREKQFDKVWSDFENSEGYKRTLAMEEAGIRRLHEGSYGSTPQGKGTT